MSVRRQVQFVATVVAVSTTSLTCVCASASSPDVHSGALATLQAKADLAQPKDRCFLYAELISQMTNMAGQQLSAGDSGRASETLKLVERYAEKIQFGVGDDSKKLQNAELLIRRTSFRLKDILGEASPEDRDTLEATLRQLNQVQTQLMTQVFKK